MWKASGWHSPEGLSASGFANTVFLDDNRSQINRRPKPLKFHPEYVKEALLFMSDRDPQRIRSGIPVSRLVADASVTKLGQGACCRVLQLPLRDGMELLHWHGHFEEPLDICLRDDSDRISFSFICGLQGGASCAFEAGEPRAYAIEAGAGNISYGPGRCGRYRQQGTVESLSVMVRPDILLAWEPRLDPGMQRLIAGGGVATGYRGAELLVTAKWLNRALVAGLQANSNHSLWLQGQALTLIGLFFEARTLEFGNRDQASSDARLLRARDRLLSDLSHAPTLAELAELAGMSEPTLTRGFRRLFGSSPYALFQRERMHAARTRLQLEQAPISVIATDLGYTNTSHFAAAFRRQFGMPPSQLKAIGQP
ncbi:helix-turn-helix transcriptional regulator [Rhodocyclus tenuis]|uniref:AraC family transcriptional regulator n=1 Tax=Rhodocyclus tenuis TaxID=1066 RepID=A0A840FZD2_RHOTE|nr:AraC family transcriptional regulator [Rhodocyclus tenuis]MBB4247477.1 AraC family transcriptional regulator [Rhodocyclus tenuis]